MKNKVIVWLILLLVVLLSSVYVLGVSLIKEGKERKIAEQNLIAKSSELSTYVTKYGDSVKVLQGMRLDIHDAKQLESALIKRVKDLEIKLKNATGIIEIVEVIKWKNKDSIVYVPLNDSTRRFEIKDKWISAKIDITDFKVIKPGGFIIDSIPNKAIIVPSFKTKGWWIFKKTIGVEVFINNTNPFIQTTSGTYIDLRKKQ